MAATRYICQRFLLFLILTVFLNVLSQPVSAEEETIQYGRFGNIHIYRTSALPRHVVLFVSGDGGWNLGVIDMARAIAGLDTLVAGIDIIAYFKQLNVSKESCNYPAGDLESLSQYLQKLYGYPDYVTPILMGYSSGATLVYTTLAQAPPNTFHGGISLGFCTDLPLNKPLCHGSGLKYTAGPAGKGYTFLPIQDLGTPWVAIQGEIDQVCDTDTAVRFVAQTGNARVVKLPRVGHGFSVQRDWMPQFRQNFNRIVADTYVAQSPTMSDLKELPLIEIPAKHPGKTFAVVISGDGGWASIDKSLAESLAANNIPTVGLDSLHYFWKKRTPEESGHALQDILQHYLTAWHMNKVLLIGYSRGADVLPFMASRLPAELISNVSLIAMLGAAHSIDFEFHVADWLPGNSGDTSHQVRPEVEKLANTNLLCIYGEDETAPLCPDLDPKQFKVIKMSGGHHFNGDYTSITQLLLREAHINADNHGSSASIE